MMNDLGLAYPSLLAQGDPAPAAPSGSPTAPGTSGVAGTNGATGTTQPAATDPNAGASQGDGGFFGGSGFLLIMVLFLVVMWIFLMSGQKREKRKRQEMLDKLKKGTRVETVGGILGTIVEVRDDELVIKVDENANTRLRFAPGAVKNVLEE